MVAGALDNQSSGAQYMVVGALDNQSSGAQYHGCRSAGQSVKWSAVSW